MTLDDNVQRELRREASQLMTRFKLMINESSAQPAQSTVNLFLPFAGAVVQLLPQHVETFAPGGYSHPRIAMVRRMRTSSVS